MSIERISPRQMARCLAAPAMILMLFIASIASAVTTPTLTIPIPSMGTTATATARPTTPLPFGRGVWCVMEQEFFVKRDRNDVRAMLQDLRSAGVDGCIFPASLEIGNETSASLRAADLRVARLGTDQLLTVEGPPLRDRRGRPYRKVSLVTSDTLAAPQLELVQRIEPTSSPSMLMRELRRMAEPVIQTPTAPNQFALTTARTAEEQGVRAMLQKQVPPDAVESEITTLRTASLAAVVAAGTHIIVRQSELQSPSPASEQTAMLKAMRALLQPIAKHPAFRFGILVPLVSEDGDRVLAFGQVNGRYGIIVVINYASRPRAVELVLDRLTAKGLASGTVLKPVHSVPVMTLENITGTSGTITVNVLPHSVALFATGI